MGGGEHAAPGGVPDGHPPQQRGGLPGGAQRVCGSPSYLFYHGLPYDKSQRAVQIIYEHPADAQPLLEGFGVDYILVSDFERSSYPVDEAALDSLYPRVYDDGSRVVYQVTDKEDDHE